MDVSVHALCKSFGTRPVLRNFSACFPTGSIHCIMGPSGCGKTTLLRLLMGLELADSGDILGAELPIAAVFQENRLFEAFSPLSNVAAVLPGRPQRDWIAAHLETLGLGGHLNSPVHSLSGGLKRRVALARALLAPASLVLLDEAFTGLDSDSKQRALAFVQETATGKTLLLVTHDAAEASFLHAPILYLPPLSL